MFTFLHTYHPQPVLFAWGPIAIHWYGLLMVLAIVCGFFVVRYWWGKYGFENAKTPPTPPLSKGRTEDFSPLEGGRGRGGSRNLNDLFFYLVLWGFAGARLYHVLNEPVYYFHHPLEVFTVWNGGLAIHGAMIAGVIVVWWHARKKNFFLFADILVVGLSLGQSIGRWGNYFNQELYGRPTSLPWGIPIDAVNRVLGFTQFEYFHPTFLYESLGSLLIFGVLWFLHSARCHPALDAGSRHKNKKNFFLFFLDSWSAPEMTIQKPGIIFTTYLFLYSLLRIFVETFRIDDVPMVWGARLPLLTSGVLIVFSVVLSLYVRKMLVFPKVEP